MRGAGRFVALPLTLAYPGFLLDEWIARGLLWGSSPWRTLAVALFFILAVTSAAAGITFLLHKPVRAVARLFLSSGLLGLLYVPAFFAGAMVLSDSEAREEPLAPAVAAPQAALPARPTQAPPAPDSACGCEVCGCEPGKTFDFGRGSNAVSWHSSKGGLCAPSAICRSSAAEVVQIEFAALAPEQAAAFPNLEALSIAPAPGVSLAPLGTLKKLRVLKLDGSGVADLRGLESLSALAILGLRSTQVSDLSPLRALGNLRELGLNDTPVTDLSPLAGLTMLEDLQLHGTRVSDLAPLRGMKHLRYLQSGETRVRDISPLSGCDQLASLEIPLSVRDIRPLANLPRLEEVEVNCGAPDQPAHPRFTIQHTCSPGWMQDAAHRGGR